jgi:Zn-dependent protease
VRISLDPTLLFGVTYLGWWFYERYDALARLGPIPLWLSGTGWALTLTGGVLLGILAHEGGHVLGATLAGGRVRALTLSLIGGHASITGGREAERASALAGPVASLLFGLLLLAFREVATPPRPDLSLALLDLARLQFMYGAVNLLPVPPLDGARLLSPESARKVGVCAAGALALVALATSLLPLLFAAVFLYAGTEVGRGESRSSVSSPASAGLSTRPV